MSQRKYMTQPELNAHRDALIAFFAPRGLDDEATVTVLLMGAAALYAHLVREEGYAPEGFLSTAELTFNIVRGGASS